MMKFESEQNNYTIDKYLLKGKAVSQLEKASTIDSSDQFIFSKLTLKSKLMYDVQDFVVNEKVPYVELSSMTIDPYADQAKDGIPGDSPDDPVTICLSNCTINNIYIKTVYDDNAGELSGMLAKFQYNNATDLCIILPPETSPESNQPYDYYFHFCWINQIVYPMNSYDQWPQDIYPQTKHCIKATFFDSDLNELSAVELDLIEHEDCFSMIRNSDGTNVLTKYRGVADLVQYEESAITLINDNIDALSSSLVLGSYDRASYKRSYDDLVTDVAKSLCAIEGFGDVAYEDFDKWALVKHDHDYSLTEVIPYYTALDGGNLKRNLVGIVELSNSVSSTSVEIWIPETEEPIFFQDFMIGELKPVPLDKNQLPKIDLDSKYFDGWVYCDGTSYPKADFPEAYEIFKYAEGSTAATFVVPYYNTSFIKSNPNLTSLQDNPLQSVPYHNILPKENGSHHCHNGSVGIRGIIDNSSIEASEFKFAATGPDKSGIRKILSQLEKDPERSASHWAKDDPLETDVATLESILEERYNNPQCRVSNFEKTGKKYHIVIHAGRPAYPSAASGSNTYPAEKLSSRWWYDEAMAHSFEWNPVDKLTTFKPEIVPGTSKARLRSRYASEPSFGEESLVGVDLDKESYPSYGKIVMMIYIGRKNNKNG